MSEWHEQVGAWGECAFCGEPFKVKQLTHRFCSSECRMEDWKRKHPRLSPPGSKPRPPWRAKRIEFYGSPQVDEFLDREQERTGKAKSRIIRDLLEELAASLGAQPQEDEA